MRNLSVKKGFTLIELLITIAIIGILAAIALPTYRDYVVKAKVTELISVIPRLKLAFAEYYSIHGSLPLQSIHD